MRRSPTTTLGSRRSRGRAEARGKKHRIKGENAALMEQLATAPRSLSRSVLHVVLTFSRQRDIFLRDILVPSDGDLPLSLRSRSRLLMLLLQLDEVALTQRRVGRRPTAATTATQVRGPHRGEGKGETQAGTEKRRGEGSAHSTRESTASNGGIRNEDECGRRASTARCARELSSRFSVDLSHRDLLSCCSARGVRRRSAAAVE